MLLNALYLLFCVPVYLELLLFTSYSTSLLVFFFVISSRDSHMVLKFNRFPIIPILSTSVTKTHAELEQVALIRPRVAT